ncbi:WhiB family transcriptional regulator [Streptomyces griseoluteus]|uniref:WhiB family transcriptional regulator n=1 Tax=Streptomyces griseoluteus TaxID=29306 RepID=UPI00380B2D1C
MTTSVDWTERAACAGEDTRQWYAAASAPEARRICARCPVRPECLHAALTRETQDTRYGIWGGLTAADRRRVPPVPDSYSQAIAVLSEYLATTEAATEEQPERTHQTVNATTAPAAEAETEQLPVGKLLAWGDQHADPGIQDQAARARAALVGLRQRYAADRELTALESEEEQLARRLEEIRSRKGELAPAKAKKKTQRDYEPAEVRAWAKANSVDCPALGRVPKAVVDAWRAAQQLDKDTDR